MVFVPVCLSGRCCPSGCAGNASYCQRWRRWVSVSSSFSKGCFQFNFSEIIKGRQIFLEPCRNSKYSITCLLRWHKTLPDAISTQAYSEPLQTSKMECFAKTFNGLKSLTDHAKALHLRCLKEFWICLCLKTSQVCRLCKKNFRRL